MATKRKCIPTTWARIGNGGVITYGFRCAACGVATRRYSTAELRDERMAEHKKSAKKS